MDDNRMPCLKGNYTMHIKIHNGIIRKLDCWYVPDLWKNLISFDTLANHGLKYFSEYDHVKVYKGALVVMKGKLQHEI